jgi:multidrug resistance efflux pump
MPATTDVSILPHIEAAKRLLQELEQNANAAIAELSRDGGSEFLAAVDERAALLRELAKVADALAHERAYSRDSITDDDLASTALLAEIAGAAAAALESHEQLVSQARDERDRLALAIRRAKHPDAVAGVYAASKGNTPPRTLSVRG